MAAFTTLTVEQFMHRFFIEESPYWTMHNAHRSRELMTKFRPDTDGAITPEELLDYSWMQFQMFIEQSPGGLGKVTLKKNTSDNTANSPTYYVQWGAAAGAGIAGIGSVSTTGAGGLSNETQMMLNLQREMFEGRIKDMKDIMQLTQEVNQKEAEIEGLMEPGIQQQLLAGGIDILKGLVNKPASQIGTMGASPDYGTGPGPTRTQEDVPTLPPTTSGTVATSRPLSMDQAYNDLVALAQLVPDIHPNDALRAVVLFAQSDTGQAKSYLSMLINQVK
jgi:hypothetical protein